MLSEKEMKKRVREEASADPDRFFPTERMRELGLIRNQCIKCGNYFWSSDQEREVCGEPVCEGGYSFIGGDNCTHRMDFIGVWQRFSDLMERRGYTPIKRYPVISRWNPTSEFTLASITDFQPYVVRGAVKPPANPLVVPQTCLRFNDVDNVGITGRHNTGFIMIGQHAFVSEEEFDQPKYFEDIHAWLVEGMGIPLRDIVYHEDAWAGGGNFGCSLEFFSKGLEIGNQVYTMYERVGDKLEGLDIRVLDMGMGQERPAWFSHGTPTSYEPNFPTVMRKLFYIAGIGESGEEKRILRDFLPYSGLLNMEEVDDIDKVWDDISGRIDVDVKLLKRSVMTHAGLYSVADHARTLLFALTDGGLPSNSGGGYNLRLIYRRAMEFINRYGWDLDMGDVCSWHAEYLVPQFPEMLESIDEVREILDHEKRKYVSTKEKALSTAERLKKKQEKGKKVTIEDLLTLYDSQGITPDLLVDVGLDIRVPADFYKRVSMLHDDQEDKAKTQKDEKIDIGDHPPTGVLYYDNYLMLEFETGIEAVEGDHVLLKETAFYPTSGGQLHDIGSLTGRTTVRVVDTFKQDHLIIHRVDGDISGWRAGDRVKGRIDERRRRQLAQHHTSTHIINGVAKQILGNHIWQAGAEKTEQKGRLDITHYESLDRKQLNDIEAGANRIIRKGIEVESMILPRNEAESRFGFRLYQGGAVPGEELRVVRIDDLDTEACGGTHLRNTSEARRIIITGTKKIQDGIVRLEYVAGKRAEEIYGKDLRSLLRSMKLIGIEDPEVLDQASEDIFRVWKRLKKTSSKLAKADPGSEVYREMYDSLIEDLDGDPVMGYLGHFRGLEGIEEVEDVKIDISGSEIGSPHRYLQSASVHFKVQKDQYPRTLIRFLREMMEFSDGIGL
ncbi:MAG: alanine--tRNA ligase [Thermoplasmatota archaeon]